MNTTKFKKYVTEEVFLITGYKPTIVSHMYYKLLISFGPITISIVNRKSYMSVYTWNNTHEYFYKVKPDELYCIIDYILGKWYPGG